MLLEGLKQMTLRWLRIPPGTSLRHPDGNKFVEHSYSNEYVDTMVDITVDDICIGAEPLSVDYISDTPEAYIEILTQLRDEFNSIVKWTAKDLCKQGFSVYDTVLDESKTKLLLLPHIDPLEFYLTKDKKVVVYDLESDSTINLDEVIVFINYDRESLVKVENKSESVPSDCIFKINPTPMQVKNAEDTISALNNAEKSLQRLRLLLSRVTRWVNVDIGMSQGDTKDAVVDSISSAINANSSSLTDYSNNDFDDNIPVIPNRKGLGKPELEEHIPNANIKDLADIDYLISKLNLLMRFPASYMDFSKELSSSAVSLIRSDLRYAKLCMSVQSVIVNTINNFVSESKLAQYEPVFSLTKLPTSEDDDVIQALSDFVDLAQTVDDYILGGDTLDEKIHRLEQLQDLYSSTISSKMLQNWFDNYREYIFSLQERKDDTSSEDNSFERDLEDFDDIDTFRDEEPEESNDMFQETPSEESEL